MEEELLNPDKIETKPRRKISLRNMFNSKQPDFMRISLYIGEDKSKKQIVLSSLYQKKHFVNQLKSKHNSSDIIGIIYLFIILVYIEIKWEFKTVNNLLLLTCSLFTILLLFLRVCYEIIHKYISHNNHLNTISIL